MTGLANEPLQRVVIEQVSKRFGAQRALAPVSLEFQAGHVCALLGHNGAGKSTLLAVLSTLTAPSGGHVTYYAKSGPVRGAALRREIGLLSHAPLCYGELSGHENVMLFAELGGVPAASTATQAALDAVGLARVDCMRPARTYSRGMWQRLSLARALVTRPSLLLLDEPFTGLDRDAADALAQQIAAERDRGAIVVVVSHDLEAIASIAEHVVILRRGAVARAERGQFNYADLRALYADVARA